MFLWCHVRHINPVKEHAERIKNTDRKPASNLNYDEIEFPVQEKDFKKVEVQNNICVNVFSYENQLVFPIYISDQIFKDTIDLLFLINDDQHHYAYDLTHLCFIKQNKNNNKKWFCKSCLQCFSSENALIKILMVNNQ